MSEKLDRAPDGIIRTCDECSREFKGEAWQDWCAECYAEMEKHSPLKDLWACLTCAAKFPVGEVRLNGSDPANAPWSCPRCGNPTITPADSKMRETNEYHGEIGTRN